MTSSAPPSSGSNHHEDDLDRPVLRSLIGTRDSHDSTWTAIQASLLLLTSLGLGLAGFQVGYRRAIQTELKDDPALKLKQVGPVSGLSARELASRAFVRGSALAFVAASVFGVGIAYASASLRRRNTEADRQAEAEAEDMILGAWKDALVATAAPKKSSR